MLPERHTSCKTNADTSDEICFFLGWGKDPQFFLQTPFLFSTFSLHQDIRRSSATAPCLQQTPCPIAGPTCLSLPLASLLIFNRPMLNTHSCLSKPTSASPGHPKVEGGRYPENKVLVSQQSQFTIHKQLPGDVDPLPRASPHAASPASVHAPT